MLLVVIVELANATGNLPGISAPEAALLYQGRAMLLLKGPEL